MKRFGSSFLACKGWRRQGSSWPAAMMTRGRPSFGGESMPRFFGLPVVCRPRFSATFFHKRSNDISRPSLRLFSTVSKEGSPGVVNLTNKDAFIKDSKSSAETGELIYTVSKVPLLLWLTSLKTQCLLLIQGGKKGVLRALKRFSLSTCTASLLGSPLLVMLGSQDVPIVGRSAIAFVGELRFILRPLGNFELWLSPFSSHSVAVMLLGVSTTGMLNLLTKGYVVKMYLHPSGDKLTLHTYDLLSKERAEQVNVADIREPDSILPFATFSVDGKNYSLDYNSFEDKELWAQLFPHAVREW